MLIYNPAFDLHHSVFRILQLLTATPGRDYEVEKLRILDFFLLFPEQIEQIRFPKEILRKRSLFTQAYNPYRTIENPRRLFAALEPFQHAALHSLAAYELIHRDALYAGRIERTARLIPENLAKAIAERSQSSASLIDLVSGDLAKLPLHGASGLKDRANLEDSRYDIS